MNREIKFRAWVADQNYMAVQGTPDLETLQSFMFHYGDEHILMQFTGLKDKNGTEIYEGDIVYSKIHKPNKMEVKFIEGGFCMDWGDANYPIDINHFFSSVGCCIEVIGNIYETDKQKTGF